MTTKFFAILTNLGAAKLANATALGTQLQLTHMAVGDGGGVLPLPNAAQTQLIGEKRRAALNSLSVDAANSSQIIAEQVIPETDGGWWIREIGLFDKDGVLIAIANCPETYKPQLQEGSGRTQTVRMVLIVSSTEAVTLKIDPSVVLATRKYADDKAIEVKSYADGLMVAHLAAADPHSQYAPKASPALTGKPTAPTAAKTDNSTQLATTAHIKLALADYAPLASPALTGTPTTPTPAAGNNTQQLANTAFVQAAIAALVASSPAALDTLKELADALGNDPNFATTMTNALAGKMDKAKNGSDIANVATFLENLGLGDAAKKGIATNAEMQVGIADKLVSLVGLMSVFGKRIFGTSDYFRFPDVPGGFIFQFGTATTLASGDVIVTFPIPFPNKVLGIHPSQNNSYTNGAWAAYASKSLSSFALSGWTNATTRIAIGVDYFAIGY
ncbi:phage tail protein [Yersinia enterocolitica]|uniref:phage tail protein n=2 Tax=Yersinia enterocolitica TaxID=630 RepID=UPI0005DDB153|nr:phage tail protein [Yersinia enterocolitica]UYJ78472.1 phage tail protein [Yersinia enterocolitica]CNE94376.1 tail fiber protein [Yersinia enterocolitica]HDL7752703.1 phage tail protein [Yersinia enterocolitica]HEN3488473.1 phage tail protein [Yersinia enterocolitica]